MAKENLDGLADVPDALGRIHSGVEPERDSRVPEIVRPLGQARNALSLPGAAVDRGQHGRRMRLTDFGEKVLAAASPYADQLGAGDA
ncbi:hypothetical protein GTY56_03600 [Streptomyces sp. SID5643]|nr:hypothetical protein [Streptomyces sp. SID5643]